MTSSSELIPNSFQVPNLLVDELLPFLSGPQIKILLLVCRKTFGWGAGTTLTATERQWLHLLVERLQQDLARFDETGRFEAQ